MDSTVAKHRDLDFLVMPDYHFDCDCYHCEKPVSPTHDLGYERYPLVKPEDSHIPLHAASHVLIHVD